MRVLAAVVLLAPLAARAEKVQVLAAPAIHQPQVTTDVKQCAGDVNLVAVQRTWNAVDVEILHGCGEMGTAQLVLHTPSGWFHVPFGVITSGSDVASHPWRQTVASESLARGTFSDGSAAVVTHIETETITRSRAGKVLSREIAGNTVVCSLESEPHCTMRLDLCNKRGCKPALDRGVLHAGKARMVLDYGEN
jgi:hypothetical protein